MAEQDEAQDFAKRAIEARNAYYLHRFMMLSAAAYAWQLHSILIGFLVLVGLWMTISVTNLIILLSEFGSLRMVRFNRWFWVALAFVALAASGASIETVG